ncbi:MAG: MOP flippase family protein [Drouetiella hepatica Uher 2000/2452]|jgi:PST family polysaccharide transporter|uniref:MOP flippase family protein n=1 Tax=Drouetiella hepatica Uher 2000/2452 TaxID=904376 RepID=A0A951QEM9_9CYAN|nr:MOP flippase family protein [Drouetiella hepatica Uher 2000/2452]
MTIKAQTIQGVVWSAIQNWGSQIGSLVVFIVLARLLEPATFGLAALANVVLAFMQVFLEQGFTQALIQRKELEPEHLDTAFWTSLISGILLTVAVFTLAIPVANGFQQPQLAPILQWLSVVFVITSLSRVQQAVLERQFAYKEIATRSLLGTLAGGITGVLMAYSGWGVWSLVGQQLVQELVGTLVLWRVSDWRPQFKFSVRHFKDLFNFGINILAFNFLGFLNSRADEFLIGIFLGSTAFGFYSVAYRILAVMTQVLVSTTNQVALPAFSRLQEDPERFRRAFYTATQITSAIAFPTFLGVVVLAPEIVVTCFGKQWMPSVPVMQVLSVVGILRSVTYFKGSIFMALGKPQWRLYFGLLSAGLNVVGFAIAVRWGIVAVAYAYLARAFILFPITQRAVSKLLQTSLLQYLRQFITPLICSLTMSGIILLAKQLLDSSINSQSLLVFCIVLGVLVYVIAVRLFAPKLFQQILELAHLASSQKRSQSR